MTPVRAGDRLGQGTVYSRSGQLIHKQGEKVLSELDHWDVDVISPWRRLLPHTVFPGFHGEPSSRLYITSLRIVLIREIDEWRELAGELYPLGLPNAAAKDSFLRQLKKEGVRQFCEIYPSALRVISAKKYVKRKSMLDLRLIANDGHQYGIMIWKMAGGDSRALDLILSRFKPAE
jgi:hypothetical protein